MEIFLEIVMELYLEMAEIIFPKRELKKWQNVLLQLACIFVTSAIFCCLIAGISLLAEGGENGDLSLGIALTSVSGALFLAQTVIFVIVVVHQVKSAKAAKNAVREEVSHEAEPMHDNISEVKSSEDDLTRVR